MLLVFLPGSVRRSMGWKIDFNEVDLSDGNGRGGRERISRPNEPSEQFLNQQKFTSAGLSVSHIEIYSQLRKI